MADPKPLTRDQLAKFLPDHEAVRRFERLFAVAGDLTPSDVATLYRLAQEASVDANTADSKAQSSLDLLQAISQDLAITAGADVKATQALDALNRIAHSLELIAKSPAPRNDTFLAGDYIDISTTAPTPVGAVGRMRWNDTDGTVDLGLKGGNVTLQIGQENVLLVKNDEATTLVDGEVVYVYGASGANLLVKRALADAEATSASTIGIVTESITPNGQGFITTFGQVRGFNTSAFNEGDILYLSPTTPGAITNTKPSAPNHMVVLGYCTKKSAGSGEVFVNVNNGYELEELHDVKITAVADKDLLQYDLANKYWKNISYSSITIGKASSLTGGVAGSLPYQTAADTTAMLAIGAAGQVLKVNAGANAPQWTSGSALTKADDTNVTLTLGGAPTGSLLSAVSLTLGWSGQLSVARGGTGLSSLTANYIPYGNGTGAYSSSGQLQFDGTRLKIGNNAASSNGIDVIKGGGFNYIAKFQNTSSASGYGVAFEEPAGAAAGYPTLIVYSAGGATTWFRIDTGGGTYFSNVTTTAAAANAVIDTGSGYQLKRSTSSARFKQDVQDIDPAASANVFKLRPIWYRSKANDDNQKWSWYGLLAEEVAEIEPRLVHWGYMPEDYDTVFEKSVVVEKDKRGKEVKRTVTHAKQVLKEGAQMKPDGVMYERLSVMILAELKKLRQEFDEYKSTHP